MAVVLVDDFYITEDPTVYLGSSDVGRIPANEYQTHNALKIRDYLADKGFSLNAIAGMVGCFQTESLLNPSSLETTQYHYIPSNTVMDSYQKGVGLAQWTSKTAPPQKFVNFCIRYNIPWWYGSSQCFRLVREYETNDIYHFFQSLTVDGHRWTYPEFKTSTASPSVLAKAWDYCYEVSSHSALEARQRNAEYWYNIFQGTPPGPGPGPTPTGFPYWLLFKFRKGVQ